MRVKVIRKDGVLLNSVPHSEGSELSVDDEIGQIWIARKWAVAVEPKSGATASKG